MYGEMRRTGKSTIGPDSKQLIRTKTLALAQSSGLKPKTQCKPEQDNTTPVHGVLIESHRSLLYEGRPVFKPQSRTEPSGRGKGRSQK